MKDLKDWCLHCGATNKELVNGRQLCKSCYANHEKDYPQFCQCGKSADVFIGRLGKSFCYSCWKIYNQSQ